MASDFTLGFHLRPAETNHAAGAKLWFVLGDSATRGNFLRAGVDFGAGQLRLVEGKTGLSAAVPLAALPQDFAAGTLTYQAAGGCGVGGHPGPGVGRGRQGAGGAEWDAVTVPLKMQHVPRSCGLNRRFMLCLDAVGRAFFIVDTRKQSFLKPCSGHSDTSSPGSVALIAG